MIPEKFPECNSSFGAPEGLAESQVMTIPAHVHKIEGGSLDGDTQVVVAWRPTPDELEVIKNGGLIYISMMGRLAPHYPSVSFREATHPA